MGFFGRRRRMQTQGPSQEESRRASTAQPAWLPGRIEVQVAGESFHQAAINAVEARRAPGSPLVAVLVPDPANAHDPNALAVYVNDEHVGFLPRDLARRVRPALTAFSHAHGGCPVACAAEIRWHDIGPQVVLLIDPQPLGLRADDFETIPDMAATIGRLLARLDVPSPPLTGIDAQARSSLARAQEDLEETDANYDRGPHDWPRVEAALQTAADRLAKAGDPCVSIAWLGLGRATRYQRGRRDDTLTMLIEALYWGRDNADAWSELVDLASAAPHVPTLLALYARVPFGTRACVLPQLLSMSEQRDKLGRLNSDQGERLREGLLDLAESQGDKATVAMLTGYAGLAAEKAGDLDAAVRWWRLAIAAGSTDAKVADRFSIWLVKGHAYEEAAQVLQQSLAEDPGSAEVAERMRRRLARCQRNSGR
jgi:tetratricopeptide (TPR) repeat protein